MQKPTESRFINWSFNVENVTFHTKKIEHNCNRFQTRPGHPWQTKLDDWWSWHPPPPPCINPFPNKPWFLRVCRKRLFKTLWEKENLLVTSNFSFSHSVFYLFRDLSAIFIKFEIVVWKLFEFERVQNLSFGKGLSPLLWRQCSLMAHILVFHSQTQSLTLYCAMPTFNNPGKEAFRNHCGKRRKCW